MKVRPNRNKIDEMHNGKVTLSAEFESTFPTMSQLMKKAQIVEFTINGHQRFRQYIWTYADGTNAGWLCQLHHCIPQGRNILTEQILLSEGLGGITHTWKPSGCCCETLLGCKEFLFTLESTYVGIGGWEDRYATICQEAGVESLNVSEFVTFGRNTNGDTLFYNYKSKEVFMFLHDGYTSLDFQLVDGQAEYTIHRLPAAKTFVDYVELVAKEWLAAL